MTEIRLDKITKRFGATMVVRHLDLSIHDGEFFTFVGPSGCGKSTLLNMIAGLEPLSGGSILFDGLSVDRLAPAERDVALVFQSYALYPHMTVRGNIGFPLVMRKEEKETIEREVLRVANLLGLERLLDKKPRELSGGQRQRVALGRAIIRRPRVFLMDEPLSNLDARLRIEMRTELRTLHRDLGITTIYVTHDQSEAMALSDRIAVLAEGAVQQCDTPNEVYQRPANVFVAGFIGSPPMNLIRCTIAGRDPLTIDLNGEVVAAPAVRAPEADGVLAGIRPEDLVASAGAGDSRAKVSLVEAAGAINWIEALWRGVPVRASARPEENLRPGDEVRLGFAPDRLSLFDEATGLRLQRAERSIP
jgi:multiple sugar transport system ATP-binding protein